MGFYEIASPKGKEKTVTLYHGTVLAFAKKIIEDGIDVNKNIGSELDFGSGFYFADRKTAEKLARKKARYNKTAGMDGDYVREALVPLEMNMSRMTENALIFEKKNHIWLQFVFDTRDKKEIPYGQDAPMIIGPMADGAVDDVMTFHHRHKNVFSKIYVFLNFLLFSGFKMQYVVKKQYLCDNIVVGTPITLERRPPYET